MSNYSDRTPVAFWTRPDGTLAPIYTERLAESVEDCPQFAGWNMGGNTYVDRDGVTRVS